MFLRVPMDACLLCCWAGRLQLSCFSNDVNLSFVVEAVSRLSDLITLIQAYATGVMLYKFLSAFFVSHP